MGALCLLPPGKGALCGSACEHAACHLAKEIAPMPCMLCGKHPGFGVPIYCLLYLLVEPATIANTLDNKSVAVAGVSATWTQSTQ